MSNAVVLHQTGGPENLSWESFDPGPPKAGEVRLRHKAVGLNFIDVYQRTGLYPVQLPAILGQEGVGVVVALGPGVTQLAEGDRVAYAGLLGAYAEERNAPADRLVKLPKEINDITGAGMMLKGMTAEFLLRRTFKVKPGDTVLFHAAAGGVGLVACQWAKSLGATVIGTVSTREKAQLAKAHGCDQVIVTSEEDFVTKVNSLTQGKGVPVVYDSVGKDTLEGSLQCLSPRGMLVSFGQASGKAPPLDLMALGGPRSFFVTRPSLFAYISTREELEESSQALFEVVRSKKVKVEVRQQFPLSEASAAHRALESRTTVGSSVLTV